MLDDGIRIMKLKAVRFNTINVWALVKYIFIVMYLYAIPIHSLATLPLVMLHITAGLCAQVGSGNHYSVYSERETVQCTPALGCTQSRYQP